MLMARSPHLLVSEKDGWEDLDRYHHSNRWYFRSLVAPMSLLPPAMYIYAEVMHPGAVFPLAVPAMSGMQLLVQAFVFYAMQLAMVGYMAMLIQRMAQGRDHDPGYDGCYALAAIAPVPLWLSSLSLLVPDTLFVVTMVIAAWVASIALLRHGVRPLLHVYDEKTARYIANVTTLAGIAAWIALLVIAALVFSVLLAWWA